MKFILHFSILLLLGVLLSTCKEQIEADNTDKQFPLSLRAERQGDGVKFNWDPANISNFNKFILVRSIFPIPTGLSPSFSTGQFSIIFESNQQSAVNFTDNFVPIIDSIYYKLYMSLNGRFVESDNIVVNFNNFLTPGFASVVRFLPDSNWVLYTDEFNNRINLINYETEQIVKQVDATSGTNSEMVVEFYEKDNKTRMYLWATQGIQDYELPSLSQSASYPEGSQGYSLASNPSGGTYMYSTQYDYTNSFAVRNKNTKAIVKAYFRSDYYNKRLITVLNPATNLIVEASINRIMMFNVNANTALLTNIKEKDIQSNFTNLLSQLVVSPDRQHFIKDASGSVYDLNLGVVGKIPGSQNPNFSFLIDASFSPDGQSVYALVNDQSQNIISLKKFSFPAMELMGERKLSGVSMRGLRALSQGVVVIGNINGNNSVLIKKYDL